MNHITQSALLLCCIEKVIADRDAHGTQWDDCLAISIDAMRKALNPPDEMARRIADANGGE